ncbi:MAG: M60 family metallopeptidase [Bacteroidaceae bacterium]
MNKLYTMLLTVLMALAGSANIWADTEDFSGKILSVGSTITSLETGKWYLLYNQSTKRYVLEGSDNTLGLTTTSPNGSEAADNLGYLIQLENTDEEGKFYLKTGLGNYFQFLTTSANGGTKDTPGSTGIYTFTQFGENAGHWSIRNNERYYMQDYGGLLKGSTAQGSAGSDRDWALREVVFKDVSELTGSAYIKYVLNKGGLVRLTNRRLSNVNLAHTGDQMQGTPAQENDLTQVWILGKNSDGYTLRNASTGYYLDDENNFRQPSSSAVKMYIQSSPNNTTTSSYINISEDSEFQGNVCLNLNGDGISLYKWTCSGDYGSDWSITLVENFSLEEVIEGLLANSKYKAPQPGKYYRLQNMNYKTYMAENVTTNGVKCENLNEDKLAQYWTLVQIGSNYALQNLCTERYIIRQGGSLSRQYTTQVAKPTVGFALNRTDDESTYNYYIIDSGSVGLHCDQGANVVGWSTTGISSSTWGFEEVELTDEFIQNGRKVLAEYAQLVTNISTYNAALANLFMDKACTTLKEEIQAMDDEQLEANSDYAALTDDMKAMVKKVKNNTWQVYTRDNGYSRDFEKFFRVRDDYKVYSHYNQMAWNEYTGMSNSFGKLSGPTGIVGKTGDIIYIYLDEEPNGDCTLQAELVGDSESPGDHQTGTTTDLHAGLNVVFMNEPSTLYIFYQLNDPEKFLANYPDMKIHIEGGELQGYFDLTRGMTNEDWMLLREKLLDKSNIVNMKGENIVHVMRNDLVQSALAESDNEMEGLVRVWSKIVQCEEELMGFQDELEGRFRNIWNAFSVNHGYMYASTYGTYYSDGTLSTVLNYNTLTTSGGAVWGPSHEIGHNHQATINVVGATEVSNNLFSNVNVYLLGITTTRGTAVHDTFNSFAQKVGWLGMDIWQQTRMYYQLYLYYHAQGHNPNFYPTLFKMLREDPIQKRSSDYDASLVDGEGNTVGGYKSYGKDDYLHMAKKMCDAAGEDLSEFFEVNGMFVPVTNKFVGDYSNYWVTTTQKDIDEAKAYMHRYPKAGNICFIDDRVKPSPVLKDSPLEGKSTLEYRTDYEDEETRRIGYSDVGQYTDYVDEYTTNGYYYNTTYSQGITTYNVYGTGAVGFKVYDSEGNLVFLSNKTSFTIPSDIASNLGDDFRIVAAEGNGYDVYVPYAPVMYRGEMTAYYGGSETPHTLYYYGTGSAGESRIGDLPANSIAYVKAGQTAKRQPTASLLAQANVVDADLNAQSLEIDGDLPFYIPTAFKAQNITFTKSGSDYQALNLPFNIQEGYEGTIEGTKLVGIAETANAGKPVVVKGEVNLSAKEMDVAAGTYASSYGGYVLNATGTEVVASDSENSPFTYVWDNAFAVDATAINDILEHEANKSATVYDLQGRRYNRVAHPGIYIVNGRRTLVK